METSTRDTLRNSVWSATALTGRFLASVTSIWILAWSGRSAPRQRRGRKAEIGGKREECRVERQDGSVDGKVVGGRAGWRRDEDAIGDKLAQADTGIDADRELRGLVGLAEERHFVDRPRGVGGA